jgi:peptidyl-prolyl cis-trans isomerase D
MLRGIQNATRNWLGRLITGIVLGMIAISFAVWGIGDIFRGFGRSTLAKIGDTEIGVEQFRQSYNDRLQQLIRQVGRPIPADQARALGLHRQLLGQMLAEAAMDENVRKLGLNLSNEAIAEHIRNDPVFRGLSGQFDPARFEAVIRQAGYSESRYVADQRKVMLRQQLIRALTADLAAPAAAVEAQDRYQNELRAVDYLVLGPAQAGDIAEPSPEELSRFFEERKTAFRAPEFRKVDTIRLSPEELAKTTVVTDEEVKKAFEADRATFSTPERREVQQIVYPNESEAAAAVQKLAAGASFAQLAAERNLNESDFNLGLVTRAQILDPAIAQAAFSLAAGEVSAPVKGRFGSVLLRVGKIEPGHERTLEEVAPALKRTIALERARREVRTQYDKIEDERGAGAALADIAKKLGLSVRTIDAIDRSGRAPDGNPVPDLPSLPNLFGGIFSADVGIENDPVTLADGAGYLWYEVMAITPSRERPLEEVRERVVERWRSDQVAARLKEKAKAAADKLKTASISEVAGEFGVSPQFVAGLRRDRTQGGFPASALGAVFQTPKDSVGTAEGEGAAQWIVFRVSGVTAPALDMTTADAKRVQAALLEAYSDDLLVQYISHIQTELGASINESALEQVIGGGSVN